MITPIFVGGALVQIGAVITAFFTDSSATQEKMANMRSLLKKRAGILALAVVCLLAPLTSGCQHTSTLDAHYKIATVMEKVADLMGSAYAAELAAYTSQAVTITEADQATIVAAFDNVKVVGTASTQALYDIEKNGGDATATVNALTVAITTVVTKIESIFPDTATRTTVVAFITAANTLVSSLLTMLA
jgi:lipoprotein-anchoring transpeptidase ErfK/SrfK